MMGISSLPCLFHYAFCPSFTLREAKTLKENGQGLEGNVGEPQGKTKRRDEDGPGGEECVFIVAANFPFVGVFYFLRE